MSTSTPSGAVVVGVDGSMHSQQALDEAVELARLEHRPLHIVHTADPAWGLAYADPSGFWLQDQKKAYMEAGEAILDEYAAKARGDLAGDEVTTELDVGDPRITLVEAAEPAAALVVGSRGHGRIGSMTLGSVGLWVSQHAPCPVIITRPRRRGDGTAGVVVGADGTDTSTEAIEFAFRQASLRHLPLTVLHCIGDYFEGGYGLIGIPDEELEDLAGHRRVVAESLAGFGERYPDVELTVELRRGRAGTYLSHLAPLPHLLVLGSRHRSAGRAFVGGSVSRAVVENARCTVAVVPAKATADQGAGAPQGESASAGA